MKKDWLITVDSLSDFYLYAVNFEVRDNPAKIALISFFSYSFI